jgi:hypothetical protein
LFLIFHSFDRSRLVALASAALLALPLSVFAQSAPTKQVDVPAAPAQAEDTSGEPAFPKPEPTDFTADSPTKEQVEGFLKASWGFDTNRVYQVQRIAKTVVPGISTVSVLVGEKGNKQVGQLQFFVLADGKHLITAGEILPFSARPYD